MSHQKYAVPLQLKIKQSLRLTGFVFFMHLGAFVMLVISILPVMVKILLATMVFCSLLMFVSVNRRLFECSVCQKLVLPIKSVVWKQDDLWELETPAGERLPAELSGSSFVHPELTVINLKLTGQPWFRRYRALVFLPDNIDAESFRRLRVRLGQLSMKDPDNSLALK